MGSIIGMEGLIIKKVISAGDRIIFYCAPHAETPVKQWQMFYVTLATDKQPSPLARLAHSFTLLEQHTEKMSHAPTDSI